MCIWHLSLAEWHFSAPSRALRMTLSWHYSKCPASRPFGLTSNSSQFQVGYNLLCPDKSYLQCSLHITCFLLWLLLRTSGLRVQVSQHFQGKPQLVGFRSWWIRVSPISTQGDNWKRPLFAPRSILLGSRPSSSQHDQLNNIPFFFFGFSFSPGPSLLLFVIISQINYLPIVLDSGSALGGVI